ncbi:MAG: hypothetical protein HQ592_11555 [Planctomycetes bacterium]|nr:hypothetical protein [Planctomycetota bacterium]
MARIVFVVMVVLGVALAAADDTPAPEKEEVRLEDLELPLSSLTKWKTREYTYQLERRGELRTLGKVIMETKVDGEKVILHDSWTMKWRGKEMGLDLQMECKANNLLRPTAIKSVGKGDDEFGNFSVQVGESDAVVALEDGSQRRIDFPADTLTDIAQFRLFSLLPRKEGPTIKLGHVMEVSELNLKGPAVIEYVGQEQITINQEEVQLHKFVYKRRSRTVEEAWVDDEGALRRIRIDGRKILTEIPPKAE